MGVVGVGHLGRFHTLNYARMPEAELAGVYDQNPERAGQVAQEGHCRVFDSIEELAGNVDAVSIAVPTDRHFEVGSILLNAGIHCLIEKPVAGTLKEADGLIEAARRKNVILEIGHIERFNPAIRVLEGFHVEPRFIESHRLASFNPRGTEVAVVLDLMIHDIDIILHLVKSPVKTVDASGVAVVSQSVDIANARIRFDNGCVANLTASRISQKKMRKLRLFQKDAYIAVDFLERVTEMYRLDKGNNGADMVMGEIGTGDNKRNILYQRPEPPKGEALEIELRMFLRSISDKTHYGTSGEEGRAALGVAMQVLDQMEG